MRTYVAPPITKPSVEFRSSLSRAESMLTESNGQRAFSSFYAKAISRIFCLCFVLLFASVDLCADDGPSSLQRLMESSRPSLDINLRRSFISGMPRELLLFQSTAFQNVNLIEEETDNSPMQNESGIAANPLQPNVLIASAVDYRDAQSAWVYVSSDGGFHWRNQNLGKPAGLNFVVGNDPSVAWDYQGRGFLVYGGFDAKRTNGENGVFISITTDNGVTWSKHNPVILHRAPLTKDSAFEDKYYISVDNAAQSPYLGHLYIPWKRVIDRDSSTQIVIVKSSDHGKTWTSPIRISNILTGKSLDTTFGQSYPIAATGPKGEVYVAWNYGPLHSIGFNKSTDGGRTWGTPTLVQSYQWLGVAMNVGSQYNHTLKGGTRVESYPSLVVDTTNSPRRGWLYLSWAADLVPNVYFSRSTDGGSTWSTPVIVHKDTKNDQYFQWMAIDGTSGDLAVMYLDSRDDAENKLSRCYVSLSRDGGSTWIDRAVDDTSFDIRRNPFGTSSISGTFAGDYSGCAFQGGKIYPSHVDMRNTYPNIGDNDVYSSVINVNAPMPVENFKARTIASKPSTIALEWTPPANRVFGEVLAPSDFTQLLYRDGVLYRSFSGNISRFDDDSLPAFTEHTYTLVVRAKPSSDSSIERFATAYAGGSPQPLYPRLLSLQNDSTSARLQVLFPTLRGDSVNALTNLAKIRIYRDSVLVSEQPVVSSDTGRTLEFSNGVSEKGYYSFSVSIVDGLGHESKRSNSFTVYIGTLSNSLFDTFDAVRLDRYYVRGRWQQTDEFSFSAPNALTESKRSLYTSLQRDTLTFFPIVCSSDAGINLAFRHAAIVDKSDTAFVEAVFMKKDLQDSVVKIIAQFNRVQFDAWLDASLTTEDWKAELVHLDAPKGAIVALRLRFKANIVVQADGWYVDDIRMGDGVSDVQTLDEDSYVVYPNPANTSVNIRAEEACSLELINSLGERLLTLTVAGSETIEMSVENLASGKYFVQMSSRNKRQVFVLTVIH